MARQSGPKLKGIADMIHEAGLDPTEWEFKRLVDSIKLLQEMKDYLRVGKAHPDFGLTTDFDGDVQAQNEARQHIADLEAAIAAEVKTWRDFRLAKQRAVDATVQGDVTYSLLDALQARKDGGGSG